jgi:hypothetical protein
MSAPSPQSRLDHQVRLLKTDLASGFNFAALACKQFESAKLSMVHADQAYDTVELSLAFHKTSMLTIESEKITNGLHTLREKLDELKQQLPNLAS